MDAPLLLALGLLILGFGLVSRRVQMGALTPPMVFVAFGLVVGPDVLRLVPVGVGTGAVHTLAEVTLALVLFLDAARIDLACLRREYHLPLRMLAAGMPLTLVLGTILAVGFFGDFTIFEAALLAAILTPTDAALGQAVVSDRVVPVRIRQTLNVESGLNDGLALPAILILAALVEAAGQQDVTPWLVYTAKQLVLGPLVGFAVGYFGGKVVQRASASGWMNHSFQQLAGLALALLAFAGADALGGNGFIATFVAGLTLGNSSRSVCGCLHEFMEVEGQLLILMTFSLFGAVLVGPSIQYWNGEVALYALLSLTVVRMLPVALGLAGAGLRPTSLVFLGWFGPRGLASILFGLLILESSAIPHREEIFAAVILTVLMSVLLHGASAAPLARRYGLHIEAQKEGEPAMAEHVSVTEMPVRVPHPRRS
jgi:NhaP-type Na+/H+ or K+/H+ antiporter